MVATYYKALIRPWRISDTVPDLLRHNHTWKLSRQFENGFLLEAPGGALFIGNDKTSSGPFHIQMAAPQFAELQAAMQACLISGTDGLHKISSADGIYEIGGAAGLLEIGSVTTINIAGAPQYATLLPNINALSIEFAENELYAFLAKQKKMTGLGCHPLHLTDCSGFLPVSPHSLAVAFGSKCIEVAEQLLKELTGFLIGRGEGLTPSGDDFLIGVMAVMPCRELYNAVEQTLYEGDITSNVSRHYFCAALRRQFDKSLHTMVSAANRRDRAGLLRSFTRISRHGHSSGIDLLAGVLFGLRVVFALYC